MANANGKSNGSKNRTGKRTESARQKKQDSAAASGKTDRITGNDSYTNWFGLANFQLPITQTPSEILDSV